MQYTVVQNCPIAPNVYRMRLLGDTTGCKKPGQFVQLKVPEFYLRRPISVCDVKIGEMGTLDLIYKVVGKGTEGMSNLVANQRVDALLGLGNGYDLSVQTQRPLLIGGGVGVPPLYLLCKTLLEMHVQPTVILGFNKKEEVFLEEEFNELGVKTYVTTVDGSYQTQGFVTDKMRDLDCDYVFTCGPQPMLKAVYDVCIEKGIQGQFSFEERMACGFGACMGCSCKTKYGDKRICKDGPVLSLEEIIW